MKPYRAAIDWDALEIIRARPKREQRAIASFVARLREHPFQLEAYVEVSDDGRANQVGVVDDLLVHYWADHGEQVVRITRIELIE